MTVTEPTGDTITKDEFVAYKRSIVRIARRYAEIHGLCSVVDDALEEAGLIGANFIPKKVKLHGAEVVLYVDEEKWPEDAADQRRFLASSVRHHFGRGGDGVRLITNDPTVVRFGKTRIENHADVRLNVFSDIQIESVTPEEIAAAQPQDAWLHKTSLNRSTVSHYVRGGATYSVCEMQAGPWDTEQQSAGYRHCTRCEERLNR